MRVMLCACLLSFASCVLAVVPDEYQPVVVEAPFSFSERVLDLTAVVQKAKNENKPLYLYLSATDCPNCVEYQNFLKQHHPELREAFGRVIFVDVRVGRMKGPQLTYRIGDKSYSHAQFKALIGDSNGGLWYPSFWLLTPELKQVRQLSYGTRAVMPVAKQLEVLGLP